MKPTFVLGAIAVFLAGCADNTFTGAVGSTSSAPVSITAVLSSPTLAVGQQTQAKLLDGAGKSISEGGGVVWSSSRPAVAVVSAIGMVSAVAPGSAKITATSNGKSASADVVVVDTAPGAPLTSDEPVYDAATNTLVFRDGMDAYTDAVSMGAVSLAGRPRIVPLSSPITNSVPVDTASNQVIAPGRDGTGKAIRLSYTGINQSSTNFLTMDTPSQPTLATHYFQYWARVNVSGPIPGVLAVKWFEAWHSSGKDRIQWNTHDHLPWTGGAQRTYWQVYDQGRGTATQGAQPVGPYFDQLNDNRWHRYTYMYRPNSAAGARDGVARMWIDGIKVIDISSSAIGVTPFGGEKPWCYADDVDALAVSDGIQNIRWGSTQTTTTPPWTYDIDDVVWWTKQ